MVGHYRAPERVLADLGMTEPKDIALDDVAWDLGALVVREPLTGCDARLLGQGDRAVITVNRATRSLARQRFSIGHEIGHWMNDRAEASFRCTQNDFVRAWGDTSPEQRANRYAADLLLPKRMFQPRCVKRPMTFETAEDLATTFTTSLTATAIRLVEFGSYQAVLICTGPNGIRWRAQGKDVRVRLPLRDQPTSDSVAYDLLRGADAPGPTDVSAAAWFIDHAAPYYEICEDSRKIGPDDVLTILWWRDEAHLLKLMGYQA